MEEQQSLDEMVIAGTMVCVVLVSGDNEDGTPVYGYFAVPGDRIEEFAQAQATDAFYPEDYGVIIEAGEGEPSEEVRQRMAAEFGFRETQTDDILAALPTVTVVTDLDGIVERAARAAGDAPGDPDAQARLGDALRMRFEDKGDARDLDQAIEAYQRAEDATDDEYGIRAAVLFENQFTRLELEARAARPDGPEWPEWPSADVSRLELRTVKPDRDDSWTWRLLADGKPLAATRVRLDAGWQRDAFSDLSGYLSGYSIPALGATEHLSSLLADLGTWVTAQVLGSVIAAEIAARLPAVITVTLDASQHQWLAAPLELARVGGRSLASGGAVFSFALGGAPRSAPPPQDRPTRILAVFPLPADVAALGLRAERLALRSVTERAAAAGRPVALTCLQYGVTREALRDALSRGEYDVIHIGGHGGHAGLMLSTESGAVDFVTAADLLELLGPQRGHVRLVVLGACDSGANQEARIVGRLYDGEARAGARRPVAAERAGGLGSQIARRLGVVVVAMRFTVDDTFARAYATPLYEGLLLHGLPADEASGQALAQATVVTQADALGVLAQFTPVLYCLDGADLRVQAPSAEPAPPGPPPPPEPGIFVGRAGMLRRMSALLRPGGEVSSMLLAGSYGIGKSACAAEYADGSQGSYERVIWCTAAPGAAARLADQIGGAGWAEATAALRERRLLVVVDGLDEVLTDGGRLPAEWQDAVAALTGHGGAARTVFTAWVTVDELADSGHCAVIRLAGLTFDETSMLAAELPRLGRLCRAMRGKQGYLPLQVMLALGTSGGHPGVLTVLDAVSPDLPHLADAVRRLQGLAEGTANGPSGAWDPVVLACAWARAILGTLSPGELALAGLFAAFGASAPAGLPVLERCWPAWWAADNDGAAPALPPLISRLLLLSVLADHPDENGPRYQLSPLMEQWLEATDSRPDEARIAARVTRTSPDVTEAPAADARTWPEFIPVAARLWDAGQREEGVRLLCTLVEAGVTSSGRHSASETARRFEAEATTAREELLAELVRSLLSFGTLGRMRASWAEEIYGTLAGLGDQAEADIALLARLAVMNLRLDDNDLAAYEPLREPVAQLIAAGPDLDPLALTRARCLDARYLAMRGDVEQALAETDPIVVSLRSPAAEPLTELTREVLLEGVLGVAVRACMVERRWEDGLGYADELVLLRARRGAPALEMAWPSLEKIPALLMTDRASEAASILDSFQRLAAQEGDWNAAQSAVSMRTLVDFSREHITDASGIWRRLLIIAYAAGGDPLFIGGTHMQLGMALDVALLAGIPDVATDREPLSEDEGLQLMRAAQGHLLAGIALLSPSAPGQVQRYLERAESLSLLDLVEETPDLSTVDFAWVDERLSTEPGPRLPFLERIRQAAGTPERLAAWQTRFAEVLQDLRVASEAETEQVKVQTEAMREALTPVYDAIRAAVGGSKQARRDLERLCRAWDKIDELRAMAAAVRLLADRRDASGIPGLISIEHMNGLLPLLIELSPPGLPLDFVPEPRPAPAPPRDRQTYLPGLAAQVEVEAMRLAAADRPAEAAAVSRQAVALYTELGRLGRDGDLYDIASAYGNHAMWLANAGRRLAAIPFSLRAIAMMRQLTEADRAAFLPDLATALVNHAVNLGEMGQRARAIPFAVEAIHLRHELTELGRDAHLHDCAVSYMVLGELLVDSTRYGEAVEPLAVALNYAQELGEQEIEGLTADLFRRAYAAEPDAVASQLRALTGQEILDWMRDYEPS